MYLFKTNIKYIQLTNIMFLNWFLKIENAAVCKTKT